MRTSTPALLAVTLTITFGGFLASGCESAKQETASIPSSEGNAPAAETPAMGASPSADAPIAPPGPAGVPGAAGAPPMMGMMGGGDPMAPLTKTPDLDKGIKDAEKKGEKKAIAAAYAKRGTFRMYDDAAGARVKYRAALDDYRASLQADPANAEAKKNKKTIEDIYKSMGRPVPGE